MVGSARRVPQAFRDLGRRILETEARGTPGSGDSADVAEKACGKLYVYLVKLIGPEGVVSLFDRALHLARANHESLKPIEITYRYGEVAADGTTPSRLLKNVRQTAPDGVGEALAEFLGTFVWLLSIFMGEDITRRQLRKVWPEIRFDEASSVSEEAGE